MEIEETNDPRIINVRGVFTREECDRFIQETESAGYDGDGQVVRLDHRDNYLNEQTRRCKEVWLHQKPELKWWQDEANKRYKQIARLYCENVAEIKGPLYPERSRAVRYPEDGYFRMHFDLHDPIPGEWRQLGVVIYMNECHGGETFFPAQEVIAYPEPGSALVFPVSMNYLHEAFPPVNGPKYILLSWLTHQHQTWADEAPLCTPKN